MTIKEFFSFKANKFFWLNILGMIVLVFLLLFGVLKWMDIYTRHGEAVVVPDVKGMTVAEATSTFHKNGLVCVVSDSTYMKDKTAGIVLDLNPAAGQKVKEGRTIYLTINTLSIPLHPIPDVADNSSLRQAQAKVLAAGFKLNATEGVRGERDWVYGIKYRGKELTVGDKVPLGASLTLVVGNGETTDSLAVDSIMTDTVMRMKPAQAESPSEEEDSWF